MKSNSSATVKLIRPNRGWGDVDWTGLREYSDLLWLLVRRDFVSKYKQTVLGPAWAVIQPVATTLVFTIVFGGVLRLPSEGKPLPLFYMSGVLLWSIFAAVLSGAGAALQSNAAIFSKIYFPRLIPPLATSISAFIPFLLQTLVFLGLFSIYATRGDALWHLRMLTFPFCALHLALLGLGFGLAFSAFTAVYRDLQLVLGFLIQLWMYLSPVIFPVSQFPERWRWVVYLNPTTVPIELGRWALLGGDSPSVVMIGSGVAFALGVLAIGVLYYEKVASDYVDRA